MIFTLNLNKRVLKHSEMLHPLISSFFQLPDAGPVVAQAGFHPRRGYNVNKTARWSHDFGIHIPQICYPDVSFPSKTPKDSHNASRNSHADTSLGDF